MTSRTAILSVRIIGDATNGIKALTATEESAGRMSSGMVKASAASAAALVAIGAAAKAAGDAASEAEQAAGGVDSVFGQYAATVHEWAENAAQSVGLAKDEFGNLATLIGSQLKNMGVPMADVAGQTDALITRAADLAATFGGTTSDAVRALSALLRGERDPIERYGVSIKQADVNAKIAQMGLSGLTGEAEKAANTQATLALLTDQTASAVGQFGREADTAAGQQQRANAEWQNAQIELGTVLLPIMSLGAKIAGSLARALGDNAPVVQVVAAAIAVLAAGVLAVNGAMAVYNSVTVVQTALQWAQNAAWLASPITWIVLGIIAAVALLVTIVTLVVTHFDELKNNAGETWGAVMRFIEPVVNIIKSAYEWVQKLLGGFNDLGGAKVRGISAPTFEGGGSARMIAGASPVMARFAAPASAPVPVATQAASAPAAARAVTNVTNITNEVTVTGALDPEAVSRQLEQLLDNRKRQQGKAKAAWDPKL